MILDKELEFSNFAIEELSVDDFAEWDDFVSQHPFSTFYHTSKWMTILRDSGYGLPHYLLLKNSSEVVGVFPLFSIHGRFGSQLVSLPSEAGPLINMNAIGQQGFTRLLSRLEHQVRAGNFLALRFRTKEKCAIDLTIPSYYGRHCDYCTFVIDTSPGKERLFKQIRKRTREYIREASRLGVKVEINRPKVQDFWRFYLDTMHRNGTRLDINWTNYLRLILDRLVPNQDILIQTASFKDKPIAGMISYLFKDTVYLYFNGSLSRYLHLNPNALLYWNLIELASDSGYKRVDLGSTPMRSTEGDYFFKSRFGASAIRYNDYSLFRFQIHRLFVDGLTQMAWRTKLRRRLPHAITQRM